MEEHRPAALNVDGNAGGMGGKFAPVINSARAVDNPPPLEAVKSTRAVRPPAAAPVELPNHVSTLQEYRAPRVGIAPVDGNWHLQTRHPMPLAMTSHLEALGGPRDRVALTYDGDAERSLGRLHDDIVSSYRALCHSLGEPERSDLINPAPYSGGSLLALPMSNIGARPSTFPASSSSSLLKNFPSHGRRAGAGGGGGRGGGRPPASSYGTALDELRNIGMDVGRVASVPMAGYDHYNGGGAGGGHMSRIMPFGGAGGYNNRPMLEAPPGMGGGGAPRWGQQQQQQQQYIPGYANSLIPVMQGPGGNGVRVSSVSTYDMGGLDGGMKGESTLLYPPAGASFEGQGHVGGGRRGPGIDTLDDFKYRKPQPLNVDVIGSDFAAQAKVHYKSERDQLDSFLSDYVEGGIKPNLGHTSSLLRPDRSVAHY